LRPVINDNLAFAGTTTNGTVRTTAINAFPYHFESDPSVWAGYRTCCGLGFTATWFHLDNNSDPVVTPITTITIPAPTGTISFNPGDPVTITNDLKMDVFDFDVTKRCELCCNFDFTFGGGVRYVHMDQDYNASFTVPAQLGGASVSQIGSDSFNGAGPTLVCDGLWRCGCSGFGLYANGRIGVLFGSKGENSTLSSTARIPGTASTLILASGNFESTIAFVEVEVGAQWCRRMGPVCPFVRVGFEGREFVGIGNAVQATSGLNNSQVGLFGLGVSAGIGF
jgi:hypothetical protein